MLSLFLGRYKGNLALVAVASAFNNIILFAGSAYMMLVYDSVLPSRSIPTLLGLFAILVVLYLFQVMFEAIRGEALLGIANGVHDDLFGAVHHATVARALAGGQNPGDPRATPRELAGDPDGLQLTRDLDAIHAFMAGSGPVAMIDLPWVLVFMAVLFALHFWLGVTAFVGTLVLAAIALWSNRRTHEGSRDIASVTSQRSAAMLTEIRNAEPALALGMQDRLIARTRPLEHRFIEAQSFLARTLMRLGGASRLFRMLLQSLILTVGALLVIDNQATGGVILASSVLSGRALAPIDMAIASWRSLDAARAGWRRVSLATKTWRKPTPRGLTLGRPSRELALRDVWITPPNSQRPVIQGVSLSLSAGQVLAIIGPSAAGKTSLIRAMLGIWKPARGEVRIDGATLDQWDGEELGGYFGYVPQNVELIDGTVAQNISRFDPGASPDQIIAAARKASLHETILGLPNGYETRISSGGVELSAGQRQRVGLARALYGDPFLVVLDEANSNLDVTGDAALANAINLTRARGAIVVMITHRPATLGPATHLAVLNGGRLIDFGERDTVLQRMQAGESGNEAQNGGVPRDGASAPKAETTT